MASNNIFGQATTSNLNRVYYILTQICNGSPFHPSIGYGTADRINATNDVVFPLIWVEPTESRMKTSQTGITMETLNLYVYALDRIDKGDSNYQQIHSDLLYLLQTIVNYINQSDLARDWYISIEPKETEIKPLYEETDENVNGWRLKLQLRIPITYNPCNSDICVYNQYVDEDYVDCGYMD